MAHPSSSSSCRLCNNTTTEIDGHLVAYSEENAQVDFLYQMKQLTDCHQGIASKNNQAKYCRLICRCDRPSLL